ncbi:MAG: NTP transferase domain-containing protein [Actinomycetia bacterium]|nr:NTP transferase domain-containing protein [Actinomycetes bacterium]
MAIILAGGRAARLGGSVRKPLVDVGGRPMLAAAIGAAGRASQVVVVGDVPVPAGVISTVEDPPRSGPAAGLAAGLTALTAEAPWVLVLASDLPGAEQAVPLLLAEAQAIRVADGICFHDGSGHPQWMLALYRSAALRAVVARTETTDLSLRRLLAPLQLTMIPGEPSAIADCDTWPEIEAARSALQTSRQEHS